MPSWTRRQLLHGASVAAPAPWQPRTARLPEAFVHHEQSAYGRLPNV